MLKKTVASFVCKRINRSLQIKSKRVEFCKLANVDTQRADEARMIEACQIGIATIDFKGQETGTRKRRLPFSRQFRDLGFDKVVCFGFARDENKF